MKRLLFPVAVLALVEGPLWIVTTPGEDLELYRAYETWMHMEPISAAIAQVARIALGLWLLRRMVRRVSVPTTSGGGAGERQQVERVQDAGLRKAGRGSHRPLRAAVR